MYGNYSEAEVLKGLTVTAIKHDGGDRIDIETSNGKRFVFQHAQCCCESVSVHDIQGELSALIGSPLVAAHKEISEEWPADVPAKDFTDSFTWTTLILETASAKVHVRWLGESNGYYGEGIDLEELEGGI